MAKRKSQSPLESAIELPSLGTIQVAYSARHREILRAAVQLISERGYKGASLRELARRVHISQPSLYHYFDSKEQLVEQAVRAYTAELFTLRSGMPRTGTLDAVLRTALGRIEEIFSSPDHVDFARFLFAIGHERSEFSVLLQEVVFERGIALVKLLVDLFAERGELDKRDSRYLVEFVTNAMSMRLLRHYVLLGRTGALPDDGAFVDFVVDTALKGVRARRGKK